MKPANDASVDLGPEFAALPEHVKASGRMLGATEVGDVRGGRVCVYVNRSTGKIGSVRLHAYAHGDLTPTRHEPVEDWFKRGAKK